jgi:hypothetical protein
MREKEKLDENYDYKWFDSVLLFDVVLVCFLGSFFFLRVFVIISVFFGGMITRYW